jgi:hypothetical protein
MEELVESIYNATKSLKLNWLVHKSIFSSDTRHHYTCNLGTKTEVKIEITLTRDLTYSYCASLHIKNPELVDGIAYLCPSSIKRIDDLGKLIYDIYLNGKISTKVKSQNDVISEIIGSIPSKEEIRDNKINEIITEIPIEKTRKKWF